MVKLKFVVKNDLLALRFSEGKERFYRSVTSILIGRPDLKKHWKADKECFSKGAVSYKENNAVLAGFKSNYVKIALEHPEFSARQLSLSLDQEAPRSPGIDVYEPDRSIADYCINVKSFLKRVIQREKLKSGCNFETYWKLLLKCDKIYPGFGALTFPEIDFDKCVQIAGIFRQHKGYCASTKVFRNLLGKADRDRNVKFRISQIGDFKFKDYDTNKDKVTLKRPDVLSKSELNRFLNLDMDDLTPEYSDRKEVELYFDFCVFMFHSFLAPCDVIKLKRTDITKKNTLLIKRKKTHKPVEIPISPAMEAIIGKYYGQSKDGYIFPIQDDSREKEYATRDYTIKKFRERVNIWLKPVGKMLGVKFPLYAYVFRHTAITLALNSNLPVSYVAMIAGTSIEMIQNHYYNGDDMDNVRKLHIAFMKAAN